MLFYKKVSWPIKVRDNQQLKWKYQSTTIILLVYAKEKKPSQSGQLVFRVKTFFLLGQEELKLKRKLGVAPFL